ncbi:unnamed protein product [Adineta ricciae]|uniref:Uncharacterized protein n=1 Tax=Adineta ricciae TaxID=249248 RepID=A0A815GKW2_ADIRI|nr:unnamed protein product [Adineta ricciae]CAF1511744.1 unnamed protein product [Adineta ricciae]
MYTGNFISSAADGYTPNIYRITSRFFGPTRSLVFNGSLKDPGFNQTNHTATNQHWYVELANSGNYIINPVDRPEMYLTADANDGRIIIDYKEHSCAWCLIEDDDFIGAKSPGR